MQISYGQTNLLRTTQPTLNTEQNLVYQKILNAPHLKNHQITQVESLVSTQNRGRLRLILAGIACDSLVFNAKNVEYTSESDYYWYGSIAGEEEGLCVSGSVMLFSKNGQKFGQIQLDDRTFEYQDLTGNVQVLSEYKNEVLAGADCAVNELTPIGNIPLLLPQGALERNCAGSTPPPTEPQGTIRVLVPYTPATLASEPNIFDKATMGVYQINQAFANSQISTQNAKLQLVAVELLNFVEESDMDTDIVNVKNNSTAQSCRDAYEADIVAMQVQNANPHTLIPFAYIMEYFILKFSIKISKPSVGGFFSHSQKIIFHKVYTT